MTKGGSQYNDILSGRLQKIGADLREVQQLLTMEGVDPRILLDFRESVDGVRHTAWAVQQWLELKDKKEEMSNVMDVLTRYRIRVCGQMMNDLRMGLAEGEWQRATEGADKLLRIMREFTALLDKPA